MLLGTSRKPSKLMSKAARWKRRQDKQRDKAKLRRKEKLEAIAAFNKLRQEAYERDGGRCRVLGTPLKLHSENPFDVAHAHHIVYRSAGGPDTLDNLLTVSLEAHKLEHNHDINIEGNGNGLVTVTQFHKETRRVVKQWDSLPVKAVA